MAKPTGALQINASHALAPNIVALVIMESDGNVHELVTDTNYGIKLSQAIGAEIGLIESVTGILMGVDHSTALLNTASGDGQVSFGYYGAWDRNSGSYASRYGEGSTSTWGGNYGAAHYQNASAHMPVRGGGSGRLLGVDTNGFPNNTSAKIAGASITSVANAFTTRLYNDGVEKPPSSTGAFKVIDAPRTGQIQYFNVEGKTSYPGIYYVFFDKDLSTAEWAGLAADPYGIVQTASGSAFSSSFPAPSEQSAQVAAFAAVPTERIAAIAQAFVLADETSSGLSSSALGALEFGMALSLSEYLASEIASDMRAENAGAVERSLQIRAESLLPVAWSGAVQFIFSAAGAVEVTAAFGAGASAASESSLQVGAEHLVAVEASATVVATQLLPTEESADFVKGASVATEHMAVVLVEHNLNSEQITDYFNALGAGVETLAVIRASSLLPVTWDGVSGFISGISQIFRRGPAGRGTTFAGRGRITIFPNRKRN